MMPRAAATAPARRAPRRRTLHEKARPDLRVVDSATRRRLRPARVGTIAGILLFCALFSLAAFQTVLIRAQSRLDDLNSQVAQQSQRDEQLKLQLADLQSPERIAQVARDRLGMIAPHTVTFLVPTPQDDANATYVAPAAPPAAPSPSTASSPPAAKTATASSKPSSSTTPTTTGSKRSTTTTSKPASPTSGATGR